MKLLRQTVLFIAASLMMVACDDFLGGESSDLTFDSASQTLLDQTVGSTTLEAKGLTFTTKGPWTSQITEVSTKASEELSWISISPDHGDEAGEYTISITLGENTTGEDRTARIVITCGEEQVEIVITQVSTEDVPSQGEGEGQTPGGQPSMPQYKKYVSSLEWTYTHWDGTSEKDVLNFFYDDDKRVTRIVRDYTSSDQYEWRKALWGFVYDTAGKVAIGKHTENEYGTNTRDMSVELDSYGRVSRYVFFDDDPEFLEYGRFEYDAQGYMSASVWGDPDGEEGSKYYYTDGLLSAVEDFDDDEDGYQSYGREEIPYFNRMYQNRYANDKINFDLNTVLLEGDFGLDENAMMVGLRMCGKFTDCLMEMGGVYDSAIAMPDQNSTYTKPGEVIPVEYTSVRYETADEDQKIVWTFDDEGCPMTATETMKYQEYTVKYNIVVTDEVQREDIGLDEMDNEVVVKYYKFYTTEPSYTKTNRSWNCQEVLKVNYVQ